MDIFCVNVNHTFVTTGKPEKRFHAHQNPDQQLIAVRISVRFYKSQLLQSVLFYKSIMTPSLLLQKTIKRKKTKLSAFSLFHLMCDAVEQQTVEAVSTAKKIWACVSVWMRSRYNYDALSVFLLFSSMGRINEITHIFHIKFITISL